MGKDGYRFSNQVLGDFLIYVAAVVAVACIMLALAACAGVAVL